MMPIIMLAENKSFPLFSIIPIKKGGNFPSFFNYGNIVIYLIVG